MFQDNDDIKKTAEDQAQGLLNILSDSDPIDIYKAICSIKCAEILTRAFGTTSYPGVVEIIAAFVESTMKAVDGNAGDKKNGLAVLSLLEFKYPFRSNPGAEAFAVRMHMFDTMIIESAKKLGVEPQARGAVEAMQRDIFIFLLKETVTAPTPDTEIN